MTTKLSTRLTELGVGPYLVRMACMAARMGGVKDDRVVAAFIGTERMTVGNSLAIHILNVCINRYMAVRCREGMYKGEPARWLTVLSRKKRKTIYFINKSKLTKDEQRRIEKFLFGRS